MTVVEDAVRLALAGGQHDNGDGAEGFDEP